jgi:hypothetical protein
MPQKWLLFKFLLGFQNFHFGSKLKIIIFWVDFENNECGGRGIDWKSAGMWFHS